MDYETFIASVDEAKPETSSDLIVDKLHESLKNSGDELLPYGSFSRIAREFDVSRELVRQLAAREGISSKKTKDKDIVNCVRCGTEISERNKTKICKNCHWVEIPCFSCGKPVKRMISDYLRKSSGISAVLPNGKETHYTGRVFCDQQCFGKWAGSNFGFTVNNVGWRNRTKCKRGHELTKDNIYISPSSARRACRECMKINYQNKKDRAAAHLTDGMN